MTEVHTCSYSCQRIECIRAQRDELRDQLEAALAQQPPSAPVGVNVRKAGEVSPYSDVVLVADLASAPPSAPVGVEELAERAAQLYEAATSAGATHEQALHEAIERALALPPAGVGVTKRELFTIAAMHTMHAGDYVKWEHLAQDAVSLADATLAALAAQQQGGAE